MGVCLKYLPSADSGQHFNAGNVPWQRVVNSRGMISKRFVSFSFFSYVWVCLDIDVGREAGGAARQADALRQEGVEVTTDAMGEMYTDLETYGWFPQELADF